MLEKDEICIASKILNYKLDTTSLGLFFESYKISIDNTLVYTVLLSLHQYNQLGLGEVHLTQHQF